MQMEYGIYRYLVIVHNVCVNVYVISVKIFALWR